MFFEVHLLAFSSNFHTADEPCLLPIDLSTLILLMNAFAPAFTLQTRSLLLRLIFRFFSISAFILIAFSCRVHNCVRLVMHKRVTKSLFAAFWYRLYQCTHSRADPLMDLTKSHLSIPYLFLTITFQDLILNMPFTQDTRATFSTTVID